MCDSMSGGYTLSVISDAPRKRREKRDCSSVTGRYWHGPRNPAWDRAIRRIGGQLGVVERVPSRFSLFLPSDPQISPGNRATVSKKVEKGKKDAPLDSRAGVDRH